MLWLSVQAKVASIRKLYFSAPLDEEFLVHLKVTCANVHASDLVSEAYNDLESGRMEGNCERLIHV